ncbi:MAG: hypothetical protein JW885_11640 [Deltaproteobacteria bacterium]|nr:hypothetical protein [Candidatus Zymogenaceae bacterium]
MVIALFNILALSFDRMGKEPPIIWDVLTVESGGVSLFAAVRGIVEEHYTLEEVDETTGRMETAWLVERETKGRFRFVIVVEPGIVHVGREIVSPPKGDAADDVYGSMLFFFLGIANKERDKILEYIREGLTLTEEPEN